MKLKKDELNSHKDYMLSFVVERYNISKIEVEIKSNSQGSSPSYQV